jgi:hypothetical protein
LDNRNFPDRRGPMWSADVIGEASPPTERLNASAGFRSY